MGLPFMLNSFEKPAGPVVRSEPQLEASLQNVITL